MESVFAAFVLILLLLMGGLTLSDSLLNAQDALATGWQSMQDRWDDRAHTQIAFIDGETFDHGDTLQVIIRNTGTTPLADFDQWDVLVQYVDELARPHIEWFPFTTALPAPSQWSIDSILLPSTLPEAYEPGILNPGEQALLSIVLPNAAAAGMPIEITCSTPNGVIASGQFTRNAPPFPGSLYDLVVGPVGSVMVDPDHLSVTDTDNTPDELVYTVSEPPTQGVLSMLMTFTQADIDAGRVVYQHTGTDADQFTVTVSDGQESIGPLTLHIQVSEPPQLIASLGASGQANTDIVITNALLSATDPDDMAALLRYTVIVPPVQGYLNLGSSFTQAQIDAEALSYIGGASDQFQFVVSDGHSTVGPFTFVLTVLP